MLRYALIATHYRAPLEWGDATLDNARAAVERLSTAVAALEAYAEDAPTIRRSTPRSAPRATRSGRPWTTT